MMKNKLRSALPTSKIHTFAAPYDSSDVVISVGMWYNKRKINNNVLHNIGKGYKIMANYRSGRVNEEMARELGNILRDVKDYRVQKSFVSITGVDCTTDLKYAKVFFSVIGGSAEQAEERRREVGEGLKSATGFMRTQLAQRLNMRQTPELRFIPDTSGEHGARIATLLHSVKADLIDDEKVTDADTDNGESVKITDADTDNVESVKISGAEDEK